jgi:dihydrofolate synthase/folylpolyglutamate synthase
LLDVAHNPQAAAVLDELLGDLFVPGRRLAVFGALQDKDVAGIARALDGRFDAWYLVDLASEARGFGDEALGDALQPVLGGVPVIRAGRPDEALEQVRRSAAPDDCVVVFGSFLTVGAAMNWLDRSG